MAIIISKLVSLNSTEFDEIHISQVTEYITASYKSNYCHALGKRIIYELTRCIRGAWRNQYTKICSHSVQEKRIKKNTWLETGLLPDFTIQQGINFAKFFGNKRVGLIPNFSMIIILLIYDSTKIYLNYLTNKL